MNLKPYIYITIGIITGLTFSCSNQTTQEKKDIELLMNVNKLVVEKQKKLNKELKELNSHQIENKISINKILKDIDKLKKENEKIKNLIKLSNQENKRIQKAIKITIRSQELLIKNIEKLKNYHNKEELIKNGKIYAVNFSRLNVREKPSLSSKIIFTLPKFSKKRVLGEALDERGIIWYKIDKGFISSKYTFLQIEFTEEK